MKMYALLDTQGTACAETALCEECKSDRKLREKIKRQASDDVVIADGFVDCTGNEMLTCQNCGATE
jgi:hypothetical protein